MLVFFPTTHAAHTSPRSMPMPWRPRCANDHHQGKRQSTELSCFVPQQHVALHPPEPHHGYTTPVGCQAPATVSFPLLEHSRLWLSSGGSCCYFALGLLRTLQEAFCNYLSKGNLFFVVFIPESTVFSTHTICDELSHLVEDLCNLLYPLCLERCLAQASVQ